MYKSNGPLQIRIFFKGSALQIILEALVDISLNYVSKSIAQECSLSSTEFWA